MSDLPHVVPGQPLPLNEELIRVVEAYQREHDLPMIGVRLTAALCNAAIDWWNALGTDAS